MCNILARDLDGIAAITRRARGHQKAARVTRVAAQGDGVSCVPTSNIKKIVSSYTRVLSGIAAIILVPVAHVVPVNSLPSENYGNDVGHSRP